jgi:hypothetical protein
MSKFKLAENIESTGVILDGSTSGTLTQEANSTTTTYSVTWPSAQTAGSLTNDGSGSLSWTPSATNAINQLTGDVTAGPATGSQSEVATVAKIQGTTVSGTTGSTNVVFSASPTLTGTLSAAVVSASSTLTVSGMSTFLQNISVTNAPVDGTPGIASHITTGDPNTIGLVIQGSSYNSGGYGPAAPTMQNLTSGVTYTAPNIQGSVGGSSWQEGCQTVQSFVGNGYIQCVWPGVDTNGVRIVGLTSSWSASPNTYDNIDYALYWDGAGMWFIFNNGSTLTHFSGTLSGTDVLEVQRSGTSIIYSQNGTTLYTQTGVSSSNALYGAFALDGSHNTSTTDSITNISMFYGSTIVQAADLLDFENPSGSVIASISATGTISTPAVLNTAAQTTLTGSAGTALCSQPQQGSSYKKVVIYLNGYTDTGTQTYTYPTAFTNTPYVYGLSAGVSGASATTTSVTFSVTSQTGFVFLEGY